MVVLLWEDMLVGKIDNYRAFKIGTKQQIRLRAEV